MGAEFNGAEVRIPRKWSLLKIVNNFEWQVSAHFFLKNKHFLLKNRITRTFASEMILMELEGNCSTIFG